MAMQLTLAVVTREPRLDEGGAALGVARLVIAMRPGMRGKGVVWVERQCPLDLMLTGRDIARFDAGPAEIGQKPPILVPFGREPFEQRELRLVVVDAAAEPQQPEDAERGRQRQRVARVIGNMRVEPRHRLGAEPADDERDRLDMAA